MREITKRIRVLIVAGFVAASGCASSVQQSQPSQYPQTQQTDAAQSKPGRASPKLQTPPPQNAPSSSKRQQHDGKYYLDDGPPEDKRIAFADIPDAVPRKEKINPAHNRPYTALGLRFVPDTAPRKYYKRGMASWYGKRYHGRKTSTGEVYDMFKMTAAHPTLAIPSYARVTRADTGESVIVRINDRGPFLGGRIIDLSFAAAGKLGFIKAGTAEVIVESILPSGDNPIPAAPPLVADDESAVVKTGRTKLYVQFGAFSSAANAAKFRAELSAKTSVAATVVKSGGLHRVVAGPYKQRYVAETLLDDLCAEGWCGLIKELPQ